MDRIDRKILAELHADGRLSLTELAERVGLSLSPCHRRVRALEDSGVISGYTISVATPRNSPGIHAMVMISIESKLERDVVRELTKLHNITKLHSTSGRYDLCATMTTESTDELDMTIDRIREIEGVLETFSTVLLAKKLDRPE